MKNLFILFTILFFCSCNHIDNTRANGALSEQGHFEHKTGEVWASMDYKIEEKTIDSCEYIIIFGSEGRNIIHKQININHKENNYMLRNHILHRIGEIKNTEEGFKTKDWEQNYVSFHNVDSQFKTEHLSNVKFEEVVDFDLLRLFEYIILCRNDFSNRRVNLTYFTNK
jgi:hypothetical protein